MELKINEGSSDILKKMMYNEAKTARGYFWSNY